MGSSTIQWSKIKRVFFFILGVIGCVGICHIKTRAPINSRNSYKNKARTHTIPLLAVSNEKMEFIYYYANECSSLDNVSLMKRSGLECRMNSGFINSQILNNT